jgi:hypothetical protein
MQLKDNMLDEVSQAQKDKGHVFSDTWTIDPKDKCILENNHTQTHL